ncbi:MAG: hypothetical protein WKF82_06980 [Nocardioidaceae bacterium]
MTPSVTRSRRPPRLSVSPTTFSRLLNAELALDAADWPQLTQFDALQAAFAELEQHDVVILQACADHWAAHDELQRRAAEGRPVRGIGYFTHSDVWHAVEHQMLELNLLARHQRQCGARRRTARPRARRPGSTRDRLPLRRRPPGGDGYLAAPTQMLLDHVRETI